MMRVEWWKTGSVLAIGCVLYLATLPCKAIIDSRSGCDADTFRCNSELAPGEQCIFKSWVCDGEMDCPGGEDEEQNCPPPTCEVGKFQCKHLAVCIPEGWKCDQEEDCEDGSDEDPELCGSPNEFHCVPNMYQCPGTEHCIPIENICNGVTDCDKDSADEGAICMHQQGSSKSSCDILSCEFGCKESLQGPLCFCKPGFAPNGTTCIDIDECTYDGYCDQTCQNSVGSHTCSCVSGYTLSDKRHCVAEKGSLSTLLFTNTFNVHQTNLDGSALTPPYSVAGKDITAMDFNYKNKTVCWISRTESIQSDWRQHHLTCAKIDKPSETWTIHTRSSVDSVDQMACEWLTGNWYFTDYGNSRVFVCTESGQHCLTIIETNVTKPRGLALDPLKGYMFYSDWGNHPKIERANIDGSNRQPIVTQKIIHPRGLAVDLTNQHLYWSDAYLDHVERCDYDGKNRKTIFHGQMAEHVYGVSIFENFLYLANQHSHEILRVHRYPNANFPPTILASNLTRPTAIHIYQELRQPEVHANPCVNNGGCEHLCFPVRLGDQPQRKCACQAGFLIKDGTKCQAADASQFLLYANSRQGIIHGISLNLNQPGELMTPIEGLDRPLGLAFDPKDKVVYYSEIGKYHISKRTLNGNTSQVVLSEGITSVEGLAVDWLSRNLYWTDDGKKTINVARLDDFSIRLAIIKENLTLPKAIVVDPVDRYIYFADWISQPMGSIGKIKRANLDGTENITLVDKQARWPSSLFLDQAKKKLYWTDVYFQSIQFVDLNNPKRIESVLSSKAISRPYGVVSVGNMIYWTELSQGHINAWDMTLNQTHTLRLDSAPLSLILVETNVSEGSSNGCSVNNGGCSDLCIPDPDGKGNCFCPSGRQLKPDGLTCENRPGVTPSSLVCDPSIKFQCNDGSCINKKYKCDGKVDCRDKSDEDKATTCANHDCGELFKCESNQCINPSWQCDGALDCRDGDDEENCIGKTTCPADHQSCNNGRCVPDQWWCDHEEDCPEGEDEKNCTSSYSTCGPDQFRCDNHQCIPYAFRCDRDMDCQDHSDEFFCQYQCDFRCKHNKMCFPLAYVCDGDLNCEDGSDEANCPVVLGGCHDNEFSCRNGDCIPKRWRCDRDQDCADSSDEFNCTEYNVPECGKNEFRCKSTGRCLLDIWKCDKESDCEDNSDEEGCTYQAACSYPKRTCKNNTMVCLSPEKMCDGRNDCEDHSDEGGLCAYDLCANHDCSHKCSRAPDGFICTCPDNMKLKSDNKTCIDIDICETWGICGQACTSTRDGYKCTCLEGYEMQDGYSCKPTNDSDTYIIFSNRHEIRRVNPFSKQTVSLVSGLQNTIALDYCYKKRWIFWTDVVDDKIWRGTMISNSVTNIQPIIDVGLATTEGLAIDWIGENIYWVESNLDQIEVAKLDGSNRTTLIAGGMVSPRAIVLDPRDGALFWTDWDGKDPRIEGCSMSGDNRKPVFNISTIPSGGWPNGLSIDYDFRRLYWIDARSDSVHTTKYDGSDHRLILRGHPHLSHPFAISLFGVYIYWTDWRTNSLVRANKFNGSDSEVIQKTISQPFDLQVYSSYRQPNAPNPCAINNGGCSHLCLLNYNNTVGCRCPHLKRLMQDKKTCEDDNKFLLFAKLSEIRGVDLKDAHFNVIPSITVPYVDRPSAVDYDVKHERIYWTDLGLDSINSAFLNGTGFETIIDTGIPGPTGFAVDWVSRNMYFTSNSTKGITISVANLNGAYRRVLIADNITSPNSLAVHPEKGYLFWSDDGGTDHKIVRASMDGTNPITIMAGGKVKGPASLTVDMNSNKLYWINKETKNISLCDFNGDNLQELKIPGDVIDPVTITVHGQSLYVAGKDLIGQLDMKDMGFKPLRDSTPGVKAMRVYDPTGRSSGTNECAKDNGGCAQLCLPVRTSQRVCKCTAGYQLMANNRDCTGIKSFLMYSSGTKIQGISLDPTDTVLEGLPPISKINMASAVDFYAKEDYIYWVDSSSRKISRIKRDLTKRETIIKDGLSGVEGLAVDWVAGNIYWTDHGLHTIEVARLNGSSRYVLLHGNMDKPRSIVVYPAKGYMFWGDWGTGKIERSHLDGSNRTAIIHQHIQSPNGLTIDYETETLYWCDQRMNKISSCNLDGEKRKVLITNVTDCKSLTLFQEFIYWIDTTDLQGSIKRANKIDGSQITVMRHNLGSDIKDLKVYDLQRQTDVGSNTCANTNGWCAELCLYRGDRTQTCACAYGKLDKDGKSCVEYDAFLLFSKVVTIESISLADEVNPNSPIHKIENATNMRNVIGLAYDYEKKLVFFSDIQRGDIQQVHFNGTNFTVLQKSVGSAEGLAYDQHTQYLYWSSYSESSIERLKIGGGGEKEQVVKLRSEDHPRALVINSCGSSMGQLFWTNWNDRNPSIQRSYMDGTNIRNIITTNIRTPNGLTIDHKGQSLYWSDARLDKIERCDFNGMNRVVILTSIPQHSFGLAVYGDFIFWTDWVLRAVLRASKYDGSGITHLRKGTQRQPMSIIAVGEDVNDCHTNPCHNNILGCQYNCTVDVVGHASCVCPSGQILLSDNRSCSIADQLCGKDQFVCGNGLCIPYLLTCNNVNNCPDNSDEDEDFCKTRDCPSQYFTCANRRCIEEEKRCDNVNDCGDASDECGCQSEEFRCDNGICIKKMYRCDRDIDCIDNSDEVGCNLTCANLKINGETLEGLVSCNTTSACILPSWICDGNNDCWDGNDERNCTEPIKSPCSDGGFACKSGNCIPQSWHCDKDNDCGDNSDEENCEYTCEPRQWQCKRDSTCIPSPWRCDGHPDCLDNSDEDNCDLSSCSGDEFRCESGRCIPTLWVCDGDADCEGEGEDESTEHGCAPVICDKDEFMCQNRRCIRASFYCDHDQDCEDGSDEPESCSLGNSSCAVHEFRCDNKECIPRVLRCDGMPNCRDHSDENNCTTAPPLPCGTTGTTIYKCKNGACIDDKLVCNGLNDCGDYSDESEKCGKNECKGIRPCVQVCTDLKIGYKCSCYSGYTYNDTSKNCDDVDECLGNPCDHYCQNTIGRFYCTCAEGYKLETDGRSCKVANMSTPPQIIVSNRYYIRKMNFSGSTVDLITDKLDNAVAVDFDTTHIYWSDITTSVSKICRMNVSYARNKTTAQTYLVKNKIEILHDSTVRNPDGIAVDWVARNLYWCDKTTDTIEVSRLDGKYRRVLLREGLQEPRALEVFPQKGLLFYTDWGDKAHLSRVNMDGTNPVKIVTEDLSWPNALTIDYVAEKLFWADASLDYIAMADLDGANKKVIVSQSLPHVFAITTFGSYLFWTDWETQSIYRARKFTGENVTVVAHLIHRPMDIQIYHPLRRTPLKGAANPCENNGGCGNLCLLRPGKDGLLEKTCACPENHDLAYDNATCIANCTSAQILCDKTYKCIPFWWQCDGHADCEDGSDEVGCGKYYCSQPGLYQCKNATSDIDCLPPTQICDGKAQCPSGSDEDGCKNYHCMHNQYKCRSKPYQCIARVLKCDGNPDCTDGEDEADCPHVTCAPNQFACSNGRCVPYVWRCDMDNDCGDASDEPKNCTELECQHGYLKCGKTGRCIPQSWQCDGDNDCGTADITDEDPRLCSNVTCQPSYFQCDNNRCIPNRWTCDYDDDCRDGSDENVNCTARNCSESERRCDNQKCIQGHLWCNGVANCDDGSDEANCTNTECDPESQFKCESVSHCIPLAWQCDGDRDCADGSDEQGCGNRECSPGDFRCKNSGCRPMAWRCDGDNDCDDASDEDYDMCANVTCPPGRFRCGNHKCIWWARVCDGEDSCGDKSDEKECFKNTHVDCKDTDFRCLDGSKCVPFARVCDSIMDCEDLSDEDSKMCKMRNRTCTPTSCEYNCTQLSYGIRCECKTGYKLAEDGRNCEDTNECDLFNTCSQICVNLPGTHKCKCDEGYQQGMKTRYRNQCVAKGKAAYMLIAVEDQLKKINVVKNSPQLDLLHRSKEERPQRIDSVAVDIKELKAFVVSHEDRQIRTLTIPDITKNVALKQERVKRKAAQPSRDALPLKNVQEPRGIAVDWVNKNIYWTDAASQTISLADYDGKRQITIISTHLGEPFAIAVDPLAGKIFWTDRGLFAKLESANLDGTNRKVLVDKNILWPVGLAIDYPAQRLYWTDAKAYTVESVRLDGTGRHLVKSVNASDPPYMIDVFEDQLFLTTSKKHNVIMMSKFGEDHNDTLVEKLEHIGAVLIIQEVRQKQINQSMNFCASKKCGDGLCINTPSSPKGYTCLCPDGATWHNMTKRCEFLSPAGPHCEPGYCLYDGTCSIGEDKKRKCECKPGYQGERCEHYKCLNYCQNFGFCFIDKLGQPHCSCVHPYGGKRCETNLCKGFQCQNGGTCALKRNNMKYCKCPPGFKGRYCEQCDMVCYNGGTCKVDPATGKPTCKCVPGYYPNYQCKRGACDDHPCQHDGECFIRDGYPQCKCFPPYRGSLCEISPCRNHCLNKGVCSNCLVLKGKVPICTSCSCPRDFTGKQCEHKIKSESSNQTSTGAISVVVPVVICLILLLALLATFLYRKRKSLHQQFKHRRIQDNGNVEINNPIYLPGDYDDDPEPEADERQPLGDTYQFEQDKSTNFANPMYDTLYTETSQGLVPANKAEKNQLLDDSLKVRYYSNGSKRSGNNSYA